MMSARVVQIGLVTSLLLGCSMLQAQEILISDTRDAYEQITAMKSLLAQVDSRAKQIRADYEKTVVPLQAELEQLRKSPGDPAIARQRKAQLLLQIAQQQQSASAAQQALGAANEAAVRKVDQVIAAVEKELLQQRKAKALLHAQDTLYARPDCPCNITAELYRLVNSRLPSITL